MSDPDPRRRFRFSLRSLLLFMVLISSPYWLWYTWSPWKQSASIAVDPDYGGQCAFAPDVSRCVIVHGLEQTAYIHDLADGTRLASLQVEGTGSDYARYSAQGHWIATDDRDYDGDREARIWNAASGNLLATFREVLDFSPDDLHAVIVKEDGSFHIMDLQTGDEVRVISDFPRNLRKISYTPDGKLLYQSSSDQTYVWEVISGKRLYVVEGRFRAFSPDGRSLVTGKRGKKLKVWNAISGAPVTDHFLAQEQSGPVKFSADGHRIAAAPGGKTFRLYDGKTGRVIAQLKRSNQGFSRFGFTSHDDRLFVNLSYSTLLIDSISGAILYELPGQQTLALSLKSHRVLTAAIGVRPVNHGGRPYEECPDPPTGSIYDLTTGRHLAVISLKEDNFEEAVFVPDGRGFVTWNGGSGVRVWTLRRPEAWWGVICLPALWLNVVLIVGLVWSLKRDRKQFEPATK